MLNAVNFAYMPQIRKTSTAPAFGMSSKSNSTEVPDTMEKKQQFLNSAYEDIEQRNHPQAIKRFAAVYNRPDKEFDSIEGLDVFDKAYSGLVELSSHMAPDVQQRLIEDGEEKYDRIEGQLNAK